MSKKRQAHVEESFHDDDSISEDSLSPESEEDIEDDESSSGEVVNCDFDFFDPQKQDFHGLRHLLRQLMDEDANLFDLSELAEIILAQPLVGTTVKTEGHESDPLALLTVLNLRVHQVNSMVIRLR
jgi:protein BCP1